MEENLYPNTAIETEDVWRVYKTGSLEVAALKGVNLQIGQGTFAALKGRSGSGKTTLLNCIGGLDSPSQGKIRVFGEEIHAWNEGRLTRWRREQVGFYLPIFRAVAQPVGVRKCRVDPAHVGRQEQRTP